MIMREFLVIAEPEMDCPRIFVGQGWPRQAWGVKVVFRKEISILEISIKNNELIFFIRKRLIALLYLFPFWSSFYDRHS